MYGDKMGKHECYEFRTSGQWSWRWLPLLAFCALTHTRVNLQTGRPVCPDRMSFSLEGHEKHYTHPQQRLPKEGKASLHFNRRSWRSLITSRKNLMFTLGGHKKHFVKLACGGVEVRVNYVVVLMLGNVSARSTTGVLMSSGYGGYETATPHVTTPRPLSTTLPSLQIITPLLRCPELLHRIPEISSSPSYAIKGSSTTPVPLITTPLQIMVNYGVVLVLGDVLARSTTGVPMSPGYGGYQTTTPASDCTTTTYATTSYYTAKCPDYYTTPYALPNYLRQIPERVEYSAEVPKYYTTKAPEYCTTTYHGPVEIKGERNKQSCDVRVASKYFTTKAPECYTTTDVAPSYYTKASE
ncbi:LOW QUALITY PROTEIN: hypothetical protein DAPPUDRAFT_234519 [Daphnia pulex]|uniref:Uncharacterized protein n=1 Tax=Daphnia pulex TaxID=6669 RepID=E9FWT3_DAPPU|nr:LOW QUALITY PROTEIN: hypothetical protein DAPPUDRAFT_234519 [Daphnia pulex]|eukprot:EFX88378.1 LOW QUALITY PROTEIN: hypothetical protein DAPPUDRAFT_234519 [Daphnia pulex]